MNLKKRNRRRLGALIGFFLVSLGGIESAQARNNSGIGLVLLNALKRSGSSEFSNFSYSCSSSLGRNGIYSVSFRPSGQVEIYTRTDANYTCEQEEVTEVLDRHPCLLSAFTWAAGEAAELHRGFDPADRKYVSAEIYHKGDLTYIDQSLWASVFEFFSWTTEAHADVQCEFGLRLRVRQYVEDSYERPTLQEWDYDEVMQ